MRCKTPIGAATVLWLREVELKGKKTLQIFVLIVTTVLNVEPF